MIATTPSAIAQPVQEPQCESDCCRFWGACTRRALRAALAFLPLTSATAFPDRRVREAGHEREQDRQRDEVGDVVEVVGELPHPEADRLLEAGSGVGVAAHRERDEQDTEGSEEERAEQAREADPLRIGA